MSLSHQGQSRPDTRPRRSGPARLARAAEVVPRGSTRWILLHLIREVRGPDWSSLAAARRLIVYADSDRDLLRTARTRLLQAAPPRAPLSDSHARALATLNTAIEELGETAEGNQSGMDDAG